MRADLKVFEAFFHWGWILLQRPSSCILYISSSRMILLQLRGESMSLLIMLLYNSRALITKCKLVCRTKTRKPTKIIRDDFHFHEFITILSGAASSRLKLRSWEVWYSITQPLVVVHEAAESFFSMSSQLIERSAQEPLEHGECDRKMVPNKVTFQS